jgi:hypothetical protein
LREQSDAVTRWSVECITERSIADQKGTAMRLIKRLTFVPASLFVVGRAYGQGIHYNYDRGANFAAYKTYQWVDVPGFGSKQ